MGAYVTRTWVVVLLLALALLPACHSGSSSADDAGTDAGTDSDSWPDYPASGVDLLLVVDSVGGSAAGQALLVTAVHGLVGALFDPLPDSGLDEPLDSLRVGVVTIDMGLSWGGNPYEDGDGWPDDYLPTLCSSVGDDGQLQTYEPGAVVQIADDAMPCPDLVPGPWAEAPHDDAFPEIATIASCLVASPGEGCGFDQQLQSMATALAREDQLEFLSDDHLLLVLLLTNEDDCSIESNELFAVDEFQHPEDQMFYLGCGAHEEFLYPPEHFYQVLLDAKGGNPNAVLFSAIAGVPMGDACEGRGDEIGGCLDHPDMELVPVLSESDFWLWREACETPAGGMGWPAPRIVELVLLFGDNGLMASMCRDDYVGVMREVEELIADELATTQ